ncbi:craniofacial development protein 2-like [Neoarius graeffei]|uniref:craniofacial development protein 2-like n=1 Tax=Neoarius graeffei TaxID=443677 RepID=UPI00298D3D16|nr:craniofacial development protein 2-like [Neoarius graeffei]
MDEDISLNPNGRGMLDGNRRSNALLCCRKTLHVASFNANTLREEARVLELVHCVEKCQIDIMRVQEHRKVLEDAEIIEMERVESRYLIVSSAWRNDMQASVGGVGLIISTKARKALRRTERHSKRILLAEFESNPITTVVVVYSPTNSAPLEETEEFYDDLHSLLRSVPTHNFLIVLGDFNTRIGKEDVPFPYHSTTNRNGELLVELMSEHDLLAMNTQFCKKRRKLWTFKDRGTGALRQLDYVLVRKKWRNSIHNSEAYSSFKMVGSDHKAVIAKIKLSLRVSKSKQQVKYDWGAFVLDATLQEKYAFKVCNRYQELSKIEDITECYESFCKVNQEAMEELVPRKAKRKRSARSKHPEILVARQELVEASENLNEEVIESIERLNLAKRVLFETYNLIKEQELEEMSRRIE